MPRLSAGRVQSVATRMIVERERERMAFRARDYWDLDGTFAPADAEAGRPGRRSPRRSSASTARGSPPAATSTRRPAARPANVVHLDEAGARGLAARLDGRAFAVQGVEEKPYRRSPVPAVHDLDAAAGGRPQAALVRAAGRCASRSGCTRTATSPICAPTRRRCPRPRSPRPGRRPASCTATPTCRTSRGIYNRKVKNAQEAHEAIRPAGDTFRTPGEVANELSHRRVPALRADLAAHPRLADGRRRRHHGRRAAGRRRRSPARRVEFATSGRTITFPGFLRAYVEDTDDDRRPSATTARSGCRSSPRRRARRRAASSRRAHHVAAGALHRGVAGQGAGGARHRPAVDVRVDHADDPGPRLRLEEGPALVPTWTAFAVVGLLEQHFARLVDYGFTASVEDDLDDDRQRRARRASSG